MSNFTYDAASLVALTGTISAARLTPYLTECDGNTQAAIDLYVWNIKASSRLYGPLSIFEVTLRNALSDRLSALYSTDWPNDVAFRTMAAAVGSSRPRNLPAAGRYRSRPTDLLADLETTRRRVNLELAKKASRKPGVSVRRTANTDDVVAALEFGFWTKLLNHDLEVPLFLQGLSGAFRHWPSSAKQPPRGPISAALNNIRFLRNRVMHFEPLFGRSLAADIAMIVQTCSWIDPTASAWIEHHSEFEAGIRDRRRPRHYF
jgi:hypothetical protein